MNVQERNAFAGRVESSQPSRPLPFSLKDHKGDLSHFIGIFRRRWPMVLAVVVIALLSGVFSLFALTPYYTARTSILLDPKRNAGLDVSAALAGQPLDMGFVESEVAVISSFNIARRVVDKLDLSKDPEFGANSGGGMLSGLFGSLNTLAGGKSLDQEASELKLSPGVRAAVDRLRTAMAVRRSGLTYVIEVAVTSRDPARGASITNAISDAYLVDRLEARYTAAQRSTQWLSDRLEGLKTQVQQSEQAVADYRAQFGLVSTAAGTIDKQQLSEINGQLALSRAKTAETKAKFEQAQRVSSNGGNIAALGDVLASPLISSLRTQEAEVGRREADLATRYGPQHPQVVNVRAELADIKRGVNSEVQRIVSNLRNEYDVAQKREKSLQDSIDRLSGSASKNDSASVKLHELERESESNRLLYESFLGKFKESREQTSLETTESRVISPAVAPREASFPRRIPLLSVAIIIGIFVGCLLAFALETLARGFQTNEQVDEVLGCATLAFLPAVGKNELDAKLDDLAIIQYLVSKPFSRFAEGVRTVRTGIHLSNVDNPPKIVMICSTVPNEGKSTVAAALAASAALSDKKVLLIDGDLRNPSTTNRFHLAGNPGLVDLLSGAAAPQAAFFKCDIVPMTILSTGTPTTNPTDVIASQKMAQLLQVLSKQYDLIVIDCPPLLAVSDGLLLANMVDSIIYVVEWNKTARDAAQRAMKMFEMNRDKVAGVVLNKVDSLRIKTYTYYSEYFGYRYNSYYHKD